MLSWTKNKRNLTKKTTNAYITNKALYERAILWIRVNALERNFTQRFKARKYFIEVNVRWSDW